MVKFKGLALLANNSKFHDELQHVRRKLNLLFYSKDVRGDESSLGQ